MLYQASTMPASTRKIEQSMAFAYHLPSRTGH